MEEEQYLCNYSNHLKVNQNIECSYYCRSCSLRLCDACYINHKSNPNNSRHDVIEININEKKLKKKILELEKEKQKREEINKDNSNKTFAEMLNQFNNILRNLLQDSLKKGNEFRDYKKKLENKIDNNEEMNYFEENKIINDKYEKVKEIKNNINFLRNSVETLVNNKEVKIGRKIIKYSDLKICSKINNFTINNLFFQSNKNEINKENLKKEIKENNIERKESLDSRKSEIMTNSSQNKETIEENKNNEIEKINNKMQDNQEFIGENHLSNNSEGNNLLNRKLKRERKKKGCAFCEDCDSNSNSNISSIHKKPHKKKKEDNIDINKIYNNSPEKNIPKENINKNRINKINREDNDENNNILYMFNLKIREENETCFSFLEMVQNNIICRIFGINEIVYKRTFLHMEKFPFLLSRLINIKNTAFVIGGKSYTNMNETGNNLVFRINYNNEKENDTGIVLCVPLKETLYCHQLHCLVYSELYNALFVLSGRLQTACEYGIIDKRRVIIEEWIEFTHLNNPRENAICFLLNEQYLFLIGGQGTNLYNYDVFDISSIFNQDKPPIWKTYNFICNHYNREIFNMDNAGIIDYKNNIYILGGKRKGSTECLNWKLYFTNDEEDKDNDDYKRIEKIELLNYNNELNKKEGLMYFLGQQKFIKYGDKFQNLNFQGKQIFLETKILD